MSSNTIILYDEDGDTPDWLEIVNKGNTSVNLSEYYLSDSKKDLLKWKMPGLKLGSDKYLLVYASGKDRLQAPLTWHTVIDVNQNWRYTVPTSEPPLTWKLAGFSDGDWLTGPSGIGFGDNDDYTVINSGIISVFMRKKFTVTNLTTVKSMWFHMDYDDGFVAYLNGTEIARAGLGQPGSVVNFNTSATSHEAKMYSGGRPDGFDISNFIHLLNSSDNVLAIQVHNAGQNSSDLSAIPFLSLGYSGETGTNTRVSQYLDMPALYPHSNFKLSSAGETVYLTFKDGSISDSVKFDIIPTNYSFGRNINNLTNWGFFAIPTPGLPNQSQFLTDVVKGEVKFSVNEMFLKSPVYLSLSGAQNGEEIRFTENGSEPTIASKKYQTGILINKNKVVRARIFKTGAIPGKVAARTYIFDEKPSLQVFSISTDSLNLWDIDSGIYILGKNYENKEPYYGANFWQDWEKPASIELTGVDGKQVFAMNGGIKIFGGWSRAHPQKSLSVFFRNEYGDPVLKDVRLFKSKPQITSFKSFVLRNSGNDYGVTRFRDGMMTNLVKKMNIDIQAFEPSVLYLNGMYWGLINLREKVNEDYLENNHKVNANELDLLEGNAVTLEGTNADYLEIIDFITRNSLVSNENYEKIASQIDIDNYIDYQLTQIYVNNRDWPGNNIKYWRPHSENGKWRWILFDTDFGFGIWGNTDYLLNTVQFALETNGPAWPNPPWSTLLLRKLVENQKFRNKFLNRYADMLNTTFVPERVIAQIDSIAAIIRPEITRNNQKWNNLPLMSWEYHVDKMRIFARNRVQNVQTHLNERFVKAGIYEITLANSPSLAGTINLNTINVPGEMWKGKYFENVPVTLTAKAFRGYKFRHWEVNGVTVLDKTIELNLKKATTVKAVYEVQIDDGNSVVINEINYNSAIEKDAGDWIELYNWGRVDLDISGWVFKDGDNTHKYIIPANTILKTRQYLVLCRSLIGFSTVHPGVVNKIGNFDFGLGSPADQVRLFDNTGLLVDSVSYSGVAPWPVGPNGAGPSLELIKYNLDNTLAGSWKSSSENLGTPGRTNSITTNPGLFAIGKPEKELSIFPNPFTSETKIKIQNNWGKPMTVLIYSMEGRIVRQDVTPGNEYVWNGENQAGQKLQSGIYICKVQSDNNIFTGKIILGKR